MKITKKKLKKIILEELSGNRSFGNMAVAHMQPNAGQYLQNYPDGERPDNSDSPKQFARPEYKTLGIKTDIEEGEVLITIGKTRYKLMFENEDLTVGKVTPIDEYSFRIESDAVVWNDSTPAHVKFDSHLEKQIKDFSGREE